MPTGSGRQGSSELGDQLGALLAAETRVARLALAERLGVREKDIVKARAVVITVATAVARGRADAALWRPIGVAFEVLDVAGVIDPGDVELEQPADSTLPVASGMGTAAASEPSEPSSASVDETMHMEHVELDLDDPPHPERSAASRPAGSTMPAVSPPPAAPAPRGQRGTIKMPIHMPGRVTAASAALSQSSAAESQSRPASEAPPSSALDVEKYAVLCAWTEMHPERRLQLHSQYGLDGEAARTALDARFEELFRENAQLRAAFQRRVELHLRFLRK